MIGDGNVVLAVLQNRKPQMGSRLSRDAVPVPAQQPGQFLGACASGEFHSARTSSLAK